MKFAFAGTLAFISQLTFVPTFNLLFVFAIVLGLDFLTGVYKAKRLGQATTSKGFRQTVDKFVSYGIAIASSCVLCFVSQQKGGEAVKLISGFLNDGLVCFIIYIEVVSIFENVIAINPDGAMTNYFYKPIHKFLTLQLKKTGDQIAAVADNASK